MGCCSACECTATQTAVYTVRRSHLQMLSSELSFVSELHYHCSLLFETALSKQHLQQVLLPLLTGKC